MGRTYHNINKLNLCGQEISQHLATRKKRKNNQVNLHFYLNQNYHKMLPILNKLHKHQCMYAMSCLAQIQTVYSIVFKLVLINLTVLFLLCLIDLGHIWDLFRSYVLCVCAVFVLCFVLSYNRVDVCV